MIDWVAIAGKRLAVKDSIQYPKIQTLQVAAEKKLDCSRQYR